MVARSPSNNNKKMVDPLNPTSIRETLDKVDKCLARLQELQYTANGGTKVISGVNLSPCSTRSYLRTSLRCKQESTRIRNANPWKSPTEKLPTARGEWQQMSLPAMLLGETMLEIRQKTRFARDMVAAFAPTNNIQTTTDDVRTLLPVNQNQRPKLECYELPVRRIREKQIALQSIRSNTDGQHLQWLKSDINIKIPSPPKREINKENYQHFVANRVSPKNKPWCKKAVLFPNPMFQLSPTSKHQKFCKTKSPVTMKNRQQTPHKFLVKAPGALAQVKIKSPPVSLSATRPLNLRKESPKVVPTAAKLRISFSPSRLANRLVSPLKSRKSFTQKSVGMKIMMSGLKHRPTSSTSMQFLARRI